MFFGMEHAILNARGFGQHRAIIILYSATMFIMMTLRSRWEPLVVASILPAGLGPASNN